jgi:hypothetical protein
MDLFGYSALLFVNKEENYKTVFSGFFSIGLLAFLLAIYYNSVVEYLLKRNVQAQLNTEFSEDPSLMVLTKNNFMFAIAIS